MTSLFITRSLKTDSPLRQWCGQLGVRVIDHSLLRFEPLNFQAPESADWWFFYSPRAAAFSLEQLPEGEPRPRLAAMGAGTAAALKKKGYSVDFVGSGQPAAVAKNFGELAGGKRVFFPRARQSRKSVQNLLAGVLTVLDAACYNNVAVPVTEPVAADVFIFTSPLNVAAYLDHQVLPADVRTIALGPSTSQALQEREIHHEVAREPTEAALLSLLS